MKISLFQMSERACVSLICLCLVTLVTNADGGGYVVAWGDDAYERTSVSNGITNSAAVAAAETSLALLSDGKVVGWGTYTTGAENVPSDLSNIAAIAVGEYHALALRSNGTVIVWGSNSWGQTNPPAGLTNVTKVAAGWGHCLALKSNGTMAAWGYYGDGRTNVPSGLTNVVAIAAGGGHNLALRSDGAVVAWGNNYSGQTNVPSGLTNVLAIAAGSSHSLALRSDHTVVAWGDNSYGQKNVPASLSNVTVIAAGETCNLAITADGRLVAWGHPSRTNTPPSLTNVTAIAAGRFHSLAVVSVDDGMPVITRHPSDRYIYSGAPTTLTIATEGVPLPAFQWRFNGTDIAGATNVTLALTNVPVAASGNYGVAVSSTQGSAVSINAKLTVTDSTPFIELQPKGNPIYASTEYTLSVRANGSWPLQYRWRFNTNTIIPGATNSSLGFSSFQLTNEGYYDVVISNQFGTKLSNPVFLNYFDLGEALNTNLTWVTIGDVLWFGVNGWPNNDYFIPAARSGRITNNQSSSIQTTVTGPGTLRFDWMVSCKPTVDYLAFTINGAEQVRISGTNADDFTDWSKSQPFYLGAGPHQLRWTFYKNSSGTSGSSGWLDGDTGWLDRVTYTNGATLPIISNQPASKVVWSGSNVTFSCTAQGTPQLGFQWQFNGVDLLGENGSTLTLTNVHPSQRGSYRVMVTNNYGATLSSNAALFVDYIGANNPSDPLDRWWWRDGRVFNKVRFVGGRFIVLGDNGSLATSEDGINWEDRTTGVNSSLRGVTYGSQISKYVVVGAAATILTSLDGTNWTKVITTNNCDLNDVAWSGTAFVATTTRASVGQPNVLRSATGVSWSAVTFLGGTPDQSYGPFISSSVTFADGVFIAAGGVPFTDDLWRSVNGTTWSLVADSGQGVSGITYGNNLFFLAGLEGYPRASTNAGLNWFVVGDTNVCNPPPPYYSCMAANDVSFGNGTFIMAHYADTDPILTSTNTTNWVRRLVASSVYFYSVTYGKGTFVAVGPNGLFQSGDVANPILSIARTVDNTSLILRSTGEIGRAYRLQSSTNLSVWGDVVSFTNTSPIAEFTVLLAPAPIKLFRVISP